MLISLIESAFDGKCSPAAKQNREKGKHCWTERGNKIFAFIVCVDSSSERGKRRSFCLWPSCSWRNSETERGTSVCLILKRVSMTNGSEKMCESKARRNVNRGAKYSRHFIYVHNCHKYYTSRFVCWPYLAYFRAYEFHSDKEICVKTKFENYVLIVVASREKRTFSFLSTANISLLSTSILLFYFSSPVSSK